MWTSYTTEDTSLKTSDFMGYGMLFQVRAPTN